MQKGEWAEIAVSGAVFSCKVTPRARKASLTRNGTVIKISVIAAPEDGKATAAVAEALAHALGVAKSRLTLLRGAISRDKVFRLD
jgi:uncharacterized protein YggU (UPF0235/DUF167 family)